MWMFCSSLLKLYVFPHSSHMCNEYSNFKLCWINLFMFTSSYQIIMFFKVDISILTTKTMYRIYIFVEWGGGRKKEVKGPMNIPKQGHWTSELGILDAGDLKHWSKTLSSIMYLIKIPWVIINAFPIKPLLTNRFQSFVQLFQILPWSLSMTLPI